MNHAHLSVVVRNECKFDLHCVSDHVGVMLTLHGIVIPLIWLLWNLIKIIMITREWIECANLVPTSAKLSIGVSNETADVGTCERNTDDVVHHDAGDRVAHIVILGEVVSKPS